MTSTRSSQAMPGSSLAGGALGGVASGTLAAGAGVALTLNGFFMIFNAARLVAALVALLVLHLVRCPQFVFTREAKLYSIFLGYLLVQLLWTRDMELALNTIVPAASFLLTLVLVGTLAAFHDLRAVLFGMLAGFLAVAAAYTISSGFPFQYPAEFSYNAIAAMYLFGLFLSLLLISVSRFKPVLLGVAALLCLLSIATTSIKVNLGIFFGVLAVAVTYARQSATMIRRNLVLLVVLAATAGYAIGSNEAIVGSMQRGFDRLALGIEVLERREDVAGYSGFEKRSIWLKASLAGWVQNPVFGYGVEAFRSRFGATSHSTPVDLLYNSGLVGLLLFYGVLASVLHRLYRARRSVPIWMKAIVLGSITCYLFISLSAPVHYQATLAVSVALCVSLLSRSRQEPDGN